jgi:hypothetical protein
MKTRKLAFYTGIAVIALAAGASTLAIQASESAETSPPPASISQAGPAITIYKSPSCGCCEGWVEHLEASAFKTRVIDTDDVSAIKQTHGVPGELASCHTGLIGDLVIEGHVPADDILAYLETPQFNTVGLTVPGMVQGSPGMETGRKDDYQVTAFRANGQQSVFREHSDY